MKDFNQTTFDTYSGAGGFIRTFIKVTGVTSGISKTIEVKISDPVFIDPKNERLSA